jgi:hypothetical protein
MSGDIVALGYDRSRKKKNILKKMTFRRITRCLSSRLERDFFVLEQEFSQKHREVQDGLTHLAKVYTTQQSSMDAIARVWIPTKSL